MARDPRSDAEKARADLARNAELGLAVPESPLEEQPSVTPQTFGDTSENGRVLRNGEGASSNRKASAGAPSSAAKRGQESVRDLRRLPGTRKPPPLAIKLQNSVGKKRAGRERPALKGLGEDA